MKLLNHNFKEIFSSRIIALVAGILVGVLLVIYKDKIFILPGMLIIIPGFMAMKGNIGGTFASRLSSGLILGIINPKHPDKKIIKGNFAGSICLATLISLILGLLAFGFNYLFFGVLTFKIILVPLFAGVISTTILLGITFFATIYFFKKNIDPNNVMGPFVTVTGDVISMLSLVFVIWLIV